MKPTATVRSLVLTAALACAACAQLGLGTDKSASTRPMVDPKTQMVALEERIFELVEDERHKVNPEARPLAMDSELVGVARQRSADMAEKNYIGHASPEGVTSASLIMDEDQDFQGLLGENLAAQTFSPLRGINVEIFARKFVDTWLGSPAHRENLAYLAYDRSGVGASVSGDTIYVTQLFATDLGLSHAKNPKNRQVSAWKDPQSATAPPATPAAATTPTASPETLRGTSQTP